MATTKKRINISVSKDIEDLLAKLAKRDQMPQATKAEQLLRFALEIEEDLVFDAIAAQRDLKGGKLVSHEDAWR